ncbi:MAG: ABC transporter ATP-binding protein [Puniceicoccales bacterium]|jgi:lipoprotein-releasing system ATP-binding protein|nr:ABC transporter ATP-binding protein [Puniceicoccales bacterium]
MSTTTTAHPSGILACRNLERHLGKGENRTHVLKGVNFDAHPGKIHAIVGPSGCGKSTLLYLLGLLDRPDAGEIYIHGTPMADSNDNARTKARNAHLGFVFQFHFLLHEFTAAENVIMPMRKRRLLGETAMRQRASELLDAVGLADKAQRLAAHLSGGEQQRVAIARALANAPAILLADEPTGNLDARNSTHIFTLLTRLAHERRIAIIMVTHNADLATRCDHIHPMLDGNFHT